MSERLNASEANVPLERDMFLRSLVRELSGTLEDVVGVEEAAGYISIVGGAIGDQINAAYRIALNVERLDRDQVRDVLVDLKARIQGDFYVIEEHEDHMILGNRVCPFGAYVEGRPSLCMMTSNVFGTIASESGGYAHVSIQEAIARGDAGCKVTVWFKPPPEPIEGGRDYFGANR